MSDAADIDPESDRVDPANLPEHYTPAYLNLYGETPVLIANYETLPSSWVSVTEWSGERSKLPPHRVESIADVPTERAAVTDESGRRPVRIADEDRREEARSKFGTVEGGLPLRDDVDRGRGIETDGGELPEHLTEMDRLDGGTNIRCLTCGAESERERNLDHHNDCPETEQGIRTDGGPEVVENQASGVSITAKLKRGTGTRDQDEIKVKAKGTTADEARANMERVLPAVESWADELRGVQPDGDADE